VSFCSLHEGRWTLDSYPKRWLTRGMRTDIPILIPLEETAFQLSLPVEEIPPLIEAGEIAAIRVHGRLLVIYDSLVAFARREARRGRDKKVAT
jgi:hypothetical protein